MKLTMLCLALGLTSAAIPSLGAVQLLATGSLTGTADLSGLSGTLENGNAANMLGGLGSGLAWAGGTTFIALPDRGPNASPWNSTVDNTTSWIPRFHTLDLQLTRASGGTLPYQITPRLQSTTLLWSPTPLNYAAGGAPTQNAPGRAYFSGRSDNFAAGASTNPDNARLDPEGIRVSRDGRSVFVSDEYGPYVYQFDRQTGARLRSYALPDHFAASHLSSSGAAEIAGNSAGRVANKGMEGLAISPDGRTLIGFMQSPLAQDGGDGGRTNRIVTIDIESGATHEYAYDNQIGGKNYNSSEILAVNDHEFLVLERDGKGLGDGSNAKIKQVWKIDLAGAEDISGLSGESALLARAPAKTRVVDIKAALNSAGFGDAQIPAKLEGMAFGEDIEMDGQWLHTLYVANDNDFLPDVAGDNRFLVFGFTDADLPGWQPQQVAAVPEPETWALLGLGAGCLALVRRRQR